MLANSQGQANYKRLMQNLDHVKEIAGGIAALEHARLLRDPQGQFYFELLIQHKEHASSLAAGIVTLTNEKLIKEYYALLVAHPEHAKDLASAIVPLHRAGLLKGEQGAANLALLIKHKEKAEVVARALYWLQIEEYWSDGVELRFLIQANFDALFRYPEFLEEIAQEVEDLAISGLVGGVRGGFVGIIDSKRVKREQREQAIFAALMPPVETVVAQGFFKPMLSTTPALPVAPLVGLVCEYLR
ncbi:hypothetical protein [Legionella tunisiensis]|uniref:hypothetical protein n=1 Tax=Legionella tunisiensis TaxID=1034944 RepID=UPI0002E1CA93|nr:hypothetical protein [Legionella tunisiensis]